MAKARHQNPLPDTEAKQMSDRFSWFPHGYINERTRKAVMNCWPKGTMGIEEVFRYIINPEKAKEATELLRTITDHDSNCWYKLMNFEYVTFSCQCSYHNKQGVVSVSPYMVLDFDKKEILEAFPGMDIHDAVRKFKKMLIKDKNLFVVLCFKSPNGTGLKVVVYVGTRQQLSHRECFDAICTYIRQMYHVVADPSGSNIDRACYLPYDPEAYINLHAPHKPKINLRLWLDVKRGQQQTKRKQTGRYEGKPRDVFERVERWVSRRTVYAPGTYNRYVCSCGYLLCEFGVAESEAEDWAVNRFDDYDSCQVRNIIRSCYRNGRFGSLS